MHPAIRIIHFLMLLGVLAHAQLAVSLSVFILAVILFHRDIHNTLKIAVRFYWRLRWVLLSIVVLYLMVTPGAPLFPNSTIWQPSQEALLQVLQRLLSWWVIVYLFVLFSRHTTVDEWQGGLYVLLKPFERFNLPVNTLLLRMTLTLHAVHGLQQHLLTSTSSEATRSWYGMVQKILQVWQYAYHQAMTAPLNPINITVLPAPRWYTWLSPLLLLGLMFALKRLLEIGMRSI